MKKDFSDLQVEGLLLLILVLVIFFALVFNGFFSIGLLIGIGIAKLFMYPLKKNNSKLKDDSIAESGSGDFPWYSLFVFLPLVAILFFAYSASGMTGTEALVDFGQTFLKVVLFNVLLYIGIEAFKALVD